MARPEKEIDQEQFEKLCGLGCTQIEIADWFSCDEDTVLAWCKRTYDASFSVVFQQKRNRGNVSIRRKQHEVAMSGNVTMLIWLGKQRLGQTDKVTYQDPSGKELTIKLAFDPNKV